MPPEKKTIIDKQTLIPISLVISILGGVWFISALHSEVRNNSERILENRLEIRETPTRTEFDEFKVDIKAGMETLNGKLDELINELLKKT